jgi:hypothetical protein
MPFAAVVGLALVDTPSLLSPQTQTAPDSSSKMAEVANASAAAATEKVRCSEPPAQCALVERRLSDSQEREEAFLPPRKEETKETGMLAIFGSFLVPSSQS